MRTLLIDNYDSYTYNLFQLIAEVNGIEPTVVTNDVSPTNAPDLDEFDNIVISPGPGHPGRPGDFGICADVIARTRIPLLGVCLGHQGIAVGMGGTVDPAPQARHGHLTKLNHDGADLFEGLPEQFIVVRYHSLCAVEPLPDRVVATAWAEDGVIMGLKHLDRPLWGLQFHPESVASEYGRELMGRFRDITVARNNGKRAPLPPTTISLAPTKTAPAKPVEQPADKPSCVHYDLHVRTLDFAADTEAVFDALFAGSSSAFWLDSAHVEPGLARFSHLGNGAGPLGETVRYHVGGEQVTVTPADGTPRQVPGTIFDYLRTELARREVHAPELPFDHTCGYVGYFGYELKADCGASNAHRSPNPDAQWIFADRTVTVDHELGRTYLLALRERTSDGSGEDNSENGADEWLSIAADTLVALPAWEPPVRLAITSDITLVEPWLTRDRAQYLADVKACQRKLLDGESYEICLTNSVRIPADGTGLDYYRRLRRSNPAPYGAYLRFGAMEVACSSPERFLRVDRNGVVESKPIKGTVRRGETPEEDRRLAEELTTSAKTFAENLMIVDLLRNDLGRVCEISSVHVPSLMAAETYTTVHQLVSTVRGMLRDDVSTIDCVRACFPGGSMTGAPKLRTMEIIDSLETTARGVYSGTIGFLGCDGTADLNIVIRTAVLNDGEFQVGAGGAIVLDSDPVEEYEEMLLKAAATLRAHSALNSRPEKNTDGLHR
jgi:para-aminobenzoate synthetase